MVDARDLLRFRVSASRHRDPGDIPVWIAAHARQARFEVEPVALADLREWRLDEQEGALVHRSGRFFRVEGRRVGDGHDQPMVIQPEVGILGVLAREIDGCLHFLVQAKAEPGNPGRFQLAPTVQATPSNYGRVHGGAAVPYLGWFTGGHGGRVLVDHDQPEHGSVFLGKRNRNVVIEVDEPVEAGPRHRWLSLGQLESLLTLPNLVSMDTRTVLACLPRSEEAPAPPDVVAWLAEAEPPPSARIDLRHMRGWRCEPALERLDGLSFSVRGVRVTADSREVPRWDQPIVAARERGLVAFLMQQQRGAWHVLVQALVEPGARAALVGPTVQCSLGACHRPDLPFLEMVKNAPAESVRYACNLSEEGGRFLEVETEHRLVELPPDAPLDLPPRFRWLPLVDLEALVREGRVNLEARSLLACVRATVAP